MNSAVFSDGSFVYIPKGVRCPMELSTYFRINAGNTGQFERTLIIGEEGGYVSYLEGCTAPMRDENQLHAAVVELIAWTMRQSSTTVQNWYPGDEGNGGIYNFVTKRALCSGAEFEDFPGLRSRPGRDHLEVSDALCGETRSANSIRSHCQQAAGRYGNQDDPHRQTPKINIVSKGISAGNGQNTYRGLVKFNRVRRAHGTTRNAIRC